jgi:succinate dehydrogenase/fumarate reductase flavoprotein subunit
VKDRIREIMPVAAGIWRTEQSLRAGLGHLEACVRQAEDVAVEGVEQAIEAVELDHMLVTALIIVQASLARTESRGAHQRRDFPHSDPAWTKHVAFRADDAGGVVRDDLPIR